jgi:HEAT repeat protein
LIGICLPIAGCGGPPAEVADNGADADQASADGSLDGAATNDGAAASDGTSDDGKPSQPPPKPPGPDVPVSELVAQLSVEQTRDAAREALIAKGPAAVGELVKSLDHQDEHVRAAAAFALGQIGDKSALPALEQRAAVENSELAGDTITFAIAALKEKR